MFSEGTSLLNEVQEIFGKWTVTSRGTGKSNRFGILMQPVTWYIETHSISGRRRGWITNGTEREEADVNYLEIMSK